MQGDHLGLASSGADQDWRIASHPWDVLVEGIAYGEDMTAEHGAAWATGIDSGSACEAKVRRKSLKLMDACGCLHSGVHD